MPSKAINRPKVISRFSHIVDGKTPVHAAQMEANKTTDSSHAIMGAGPRADMFRYDLVVDPPPPSALGAPRPYPPRLLVARCLPACLPAAMPCCL